MTDTKDKKREKLGILCCTAGATSWGLSGTCSEALVSQYPVDTTWVTAVRMTSAGIILLFLAFAKHSLNLKELGKDKKGLIEIVLFGIFLALFGVWLLATGGKPGNMELTPRGLFWGLMAGIGAASYSLLSRAPVKHRGSIPVSGMGMFIGGLALSLIAQSWKIPAGLDGRAILYMAVIVLLGTVGAFTLFLQGIALVGPVKAALLSCLEPLTAATLSVVWLHSSFSPTDLIGFACILATVVLMR